MKDKPRKRAAALKYSGLGAPTVVARGEGNTALKIQELASEHGIPLIQDEALTGMLSHVPLGEEIPESLYVAVAEVLALIYKIEGLRSSQFETQA
jgi:flagellar biosynthesis protein